ncbi:maternal protein tudor-like [Adelges cooleyi]|uniref:maternal protein tudor-like n=1 Tax=Adelges cooleyi TaxID=133065 RepID=UPI00217FFAED|nr:maternal protein tudor-like [Adelges cooleyi]XP_050419578.1 maternal protein tudor-like [Adelges cooleyi]XP_050419580.1 maternal protein tudor-like [Adelges cooleyi]XP_050419581.1 maternal protein tudor-like [Adelges cooleyi]XP_050419582.1 maternal protein tudor-like [Adelges cooleyi]
MPKSLTDMSNEESIGYDFINIVGVRWHVRIAYFNSLKDFYVHKLNDLKVLQNIKAEVQSIKSELLKFECVHIGDLVAAQYNDDGVWYRAKVISIQETDCRVQFVDYGNTETTSNIKRLPDELVKVLPLAHPCVLDNIDSEEQVLLNNYGMAEVIADFMSYNDMILEFLNNSKPHIIKMTWDGRNIKEILNNMIAFGITRQIYEKLKTFDQLGSKQPVTIINIQSIGEFYVQTEVDKNLKSQVDDELNGNTTWHPVVDVKVGKEAVAKSVEDNSWYRIRVLEVHDDVLCTCYFVDYGTQGMCSDFYEAQGIVESTPPTIKRCMLNMTDDHKRFFGESLMKSFVDEMKMCQEQSITMSIVKAGEPCVVDIEVDGVHLADILKPLAVVVTQITHVNALTVQLVTAGRRGILNQLNKVKSLNLVKSPKVGKLYAAYINASWVRVKLEKIGQKKMMVATLVDFAGEMAEVDQLFSLPEHIANAKTMMLHCSLGLDELLYSTIKLRSLCNNGTTEFTMIITAHNVQSGHTVDLYKDNVNVSGMIRRTLSKSSNC